MHLHGNGTIRTASAALALALALGLASRAASAQTELSIAEVFYDAVGGDDQLEWIELLNAGEFPIDLTDMSLGWGGSSYTSGRQALEGSIGPGARFVVGGPLSTEANASPHFDLAVDLEPDLQNSGTTADGVGLFDIPAAELLPESIPISVVVYGGANTSGLVDETGAIAAVDVADAPAGSSIERGLDGVWRVQPMPTPGAPPAPVSEPAALALAAASAGTLALVSRIALGRTAASSAGTP